jgi:transposase
VDAAGRYHASFVVEVPAQPLPATGREVGIDLGLSTFAALSDGRKLDNPRFARRAQRKLAWAQQALARKQKGSKNRAKARARVARCHAKVRDTRRDWLHQQSTRIIRDNQAVYVEDLAVAGLARSRMARGVRCGLVHVRGHAGLQGGPPRAGLRQGRPLVPLHPPVLGLWGGRGAQAAAGACVDLPVRGGP